jgi:hypothetical protein
VERGARIGERDFSGAMHFYLLDERATTTKNVTADVQQIRSLLAHERAFISQIKS